MKKILFYSDSPIATTGLGRVTRYLLPAFTNDFKIIQIGLNHQDIHISPKGVLANYDHEKYKWEIISTYMQKDPYAVESTKQLLSKYKFDYIVFSIDINRAIPFYPEIIAQQKLGAKFILYTPIDRMNVLKSEAEAFKIPDTLLVLSDYAKDTLSKIGIESHRIYHPIDLKEFPILPKEEVDKFKKEYFKNWNKDAYIIGNINRNQFRKDLARTLYIFKEYSKTDKKARLYLHCNPVDEGYDIRQTIEEMGILSSDVQFADISSPAYGLEQETLNKIYQSLNLVISTSKGEGFGFSTVEAMATKKPLLVPNNTSFTELVSGRGNISECKEWVIDYGISNCIRSIADSEDMVKQIRKIRTQTDQQQIDEAYKFVKEELSPKKFISEWSKILIK